MNTLYSKTKCLDFPELIEIKLFQIFMELNKNYGVTYMSYTFDKANLVRYCFRTDLEWARIYQNEKLLNQPIIEACPLDVVSRQKKNIFIIWDLYSHRIQPKLHREIMGLRDDIGLSHGLTLSTYFSEHHDALAIATDDKKNDLATSILLNNCGIDMKSNLIKCRSEVVNFFNNNQGIND